MNAQTRGGKPRTIVVERIEPFGSRSEVIRIFFIPVIVIGGGPDKLFQSEGEVDMERQCGFVFGPVIISEGGKVSERREANAAGRSNAPVVIIEVCVFV